MGGSSSIWQVGLGGVVPQRPWGVGVTLVAGGGGGAPYMFLQPSLGKVVGQKQKALKGNLTKCSSANFLNGVKCAKSRWE